MRKRFAMNAVAYAAASCAMLITSAASQAQTPLADKPIFSRVATPHNLVLALSVEFPTAISVTHPDRNYSSNNNYIGYFDPAKCYIYTAGNSRATPQIPNHFAPTRITATRTCGRSGEWSGNFLNWASMQTIDPFRQILTGGFRRYDEPNLTILEKAWSSFDQGGDGNFPNSVLTDSATINGATPFGTSTTRLDLSTRTRGIQLRFIRSSAASPPVPTFTTATTRASAAVPDLLTFLPSGTLPADGQEYSVDARVKVCDAAVGLEKNCVGYKDAAKPEGLLQEYSDRLKYSVFGYLNDPSTSEANNNKRDGGVLRASMKFIGPEEPVPNAPSKTNLLSEWDPITGKMADDPSPSDSAETNSTYAPKDRIRNSGVMNYLNKFGSDAGNVFTDPIDKRYKRYDPVSELYYSALRYYRNLGNVAEYSAIPRGTPVDPLLDSFPVVTNWKDPISYACQKNFILGIGDTNTHADRNLPGATGTIEPPQPSAVSSDPFNALTSTKRVGTYAGIANLETAQPYIGCCNGSGALMAGLAYLANTTDIRPDLSKPNFEKQTIQTYWLNILEGGNRERNNQYLLAAKYGGFKIPAGVTFTDASYPTTDIPKEWWHTNGETIPVSRESVGQLRPDNYFEADKAEQIQQGLIKAFNEIDKAGQAGSTPFSGASPQFSGVGADGYSANYAAGDWSGEVTASKTKLSSTTGKLESTPVWNFSSRLASQLAADANARRIVTFNPTSRAGVPFQHGSLTRDQQTLLDTSYVAAPDSEDFVRYLRGDTTKARTSATDPDTGGTRPYRFRSSLVGDIVGFKVRTVGRPSAPYNESDNLGYTDFKSRLSARPTVVYAGTNAGFIHAINGTTDTTDPKHGHEIFAYVPNAVLAGTSVPRAASVNGLQTQGNPDFVHYNRVDAPARVLDIDFGYTANPRGVLEITSPEWRTVMVGGLGKGGRGIYALDITHPDRTVSGGVLPADVAGGEAAHARKVLWEVTSDDPDFADLGFVYSEPAIFKTKRHGWVVMVTSGYNNKNGGGFFFLINPKTGKLLQKIPLSAPISGEVGMAGPGAFVNDIGNGEADAVYAGDLLGNVWRVDLSGTAVYPQAEKIAILEGPDGSKLPVTTKVLPIEQPGTQRRWLAVGTGRLLENRDVRSPQVNRLFAIVDGFNSSISRTADLAKVGMAFPLEVKNLLKNSDVTVRKEIDFNKYAGWYVDLEKSSEGFGWRVTTELDGFFGRVAFPASVPDQTDVCNPSGNSRVYAIDLGTGQSTLKGRAPYAAISGYFAGLTTVSVDGVSKLIGGTDSVPGPEEFAEEAPAGTKVKRINWREIKGTKGQ